MITSQLIANGIIAGSMYALIASGFSLIYSANRFVHFAHGAVAAAGGYIALYMFTTLGLPFVAAAGLAIMATAVLGLLIYIGVYRVLEKRNSSKAILLVASLGLLFFIENILLLLFGPQTEILTFLEVTKGKEIFGAIVTLFQMWIVIISLFLLVLLWLFVNKTKPGKLMRAVADNPELAKTTGINITKIQYLGFAIGSGLAGIAGILIGMEQNLTPTMGTMLIVKGFTGAVIGGVTSLPGSVLGSYLLGLIENVGVWYFSSGYKDAIAFILLLIFLLVRPQGILGINKGVRQ